MTSIIETLGRLKLLAFASAYATFLVASGRIGNTLLPTAKLGALESLPSILVVGFFCIGGTAIASIWVGPLWQRVTPIRDRITHIENEIVFGLSAVTGGLLTSYLMPYGFKDAILGGLVGAGVAAPFSLAHWRSRLRLYPIDDELASRAGREIEAAIRKSHFWWNGLAYLCAALVTTATILVGLGLAVSMIRSEQSVLSVLGGFLNATAVCFAVTAVSGAFVVVVGRKISGRYDRAGLHYFGGHLVLTILAVALTSGICHATGVEMIAIWAMGLAAVIVATGYAIGALAFSLMYRVPDTAPT